jgi:hypothetical protein
MAKGTTDKAVLPTIWEIPDEVWPIMQTILDEHYPPKPKGHRRVDLRRVLNGVIFRLRTGCQWSRLPEAFGQHRAPTLPALVSPGDLRPPLGGAGGGVQRVARRRLAVASRRHSHG